MRTSGFEQDHLEAVAKRNADLYFSDKLEFENKLKIIGWSDLEIIQMEKIIERKCKNESI